MSAEIPVTPPAARSDEPKRRPVWRYLTETYASDRALARSISVVPVDDDRDLNKSSDRTDLLLKRWLALKAVRWMKWQLLSANVVFVVYAWAGVHWRIPTAAINAWLGATVIQVVGIVYVIARYVFPQAGTPLGAATARHEPSTAR